LGLIVKNEEKVITRCIASWAPLVDMVVVVDTGSTDATAAALASACEAEGLPLVLTEHEWDGFGDARTELLRQAATTDADIMLMVDADWVAEVDQETSLDVLRELDATYVDAWNLTIHEQGLEWPLPMVTSTSHAWMYSGPVHEYLTDDGAGGVVAGAIKGIKAHHFADGGSRVGRHHRDIETLRGREDPRSKFYYAQSLFAVGRYEEALAAYRERASLTEGWAEEGYFSLYRAAHCALKLERADEAVGLYLYAWGMRQNRIEALLGAVEVWRSLGVYPMSRRFAEIAVEIADDGAGLKDRLFIERWRWQWGARWELAVAMLSFPAEKEEGLRQLIAIRDSYDLPSGYAAATAYNISWAKDYRDDKYPRRLDVSS
jgi:glycosyltransferase involved in cell wall biosynthesis